MHLGARVDAAIKASGKTGEEIARTLGVDPNTISRIRTGKEDNPKVQLLIGIARETGTRVGTLLGESIEISPEDEKTLLAFRNWIDSKLITLDARKQPNAEIVRSAQPQILESRIADRPLQPQQTRDAAFDESIHLVLKAIGDSMTDAGIVNGDHLYAIPTGPRAEVTASLTGQIVACRLGGDLFVKRLVTEHRRIVLLSAHPRYQPIRVDPTEHMEILGVVVRRVGSIKTERADAS